MHGTTAMPVSEDGLQLAGRSDRYAGKLQGMRAEEDACALRPDRLRQTIRVGRRDMHHAAESVIRPNGGERGGGLPAAESRDH
jgi:hypothetical protein